jgi:hypothetical protein
VNVLCEDSPESARSAGADVPPLPPPLPEPTDYAAQLKELRKQARAIDAKWASGNLDDDGRAEQLSELDDKIDALTRAQVKAELLADQARAAAEARAKAENAAMRAVAEAEAKAIAQKQPGIDYAKDTAAAKTFDAIYGALKADPDNRGKPIADLVAQANKAVKAMRGMLTPKAAAPAPEPKTKPAIPQTLGNLPAAAAQPIGADLDAELMAIEDPDVLEAKWAALPASHRQAALRATLPVKPRRR